MSRHPFRTDIEGLRAVALLTVLGFHASVPLLTGGYIGVDVFFVISGFLITGLLLRQLREDGRISLAEFYARRARRILPAAAVVLVATGVASWLLLPPLRQRDVAWDVIAAAANVGNWRFIAAQTDYLAAGQAHSPLLHYWSLAVEEQFYLIWAPLLLLVALAFRRRIAIPIVMGLVTAGSFALSLHWTQTSEPLAYLASPARAWQFGLGGLAAAAVAWSRSAPGSRSASRSRPAPWSRFAAKRGLGAGNGHALLQNVTGVAGVLAIGVSAVAFTAETAFPGTAALLPTLGAVGVVLAGPLSAVGRALSIGWVRRIGRLSFAWYLWHWPVLVLTEARLGEQPWPVKLALVLASALPAWITMRLVERPLRFSAVVSALPRRGLSIGLTSIVAPLVVALLLGTAALNALKSSPPQAAVNALTGALDGPNLTVTPILTGVYPGPLQARDDLPPVGDCQVDPAATTSPACRFVTPSAAPADRIVLFGDSHAAQWYPAAERIAAARGWAVEVLTKSGCPIATLEITNPQLGRAYHECDEWRENALRRIESGPAPKLVVVSSLNRYEGDPVALLAAWDGPMRRLTATGAPVVYLRDTPFPATDVPTCLSGHIAAPQECAFARSSGLWTDPLADQILAGKRPGAYVVSVDDVLCPTPSCPTVLDGVLLYRDDAHLTNTAATLLAPRIEQTLIKYGVLPGRLA
ncbi:peptidoglycan/LPS O-acetylase OafA/YrhL [Allocatelliglobosispora scoriae]|uniref:Peptidoglycan/LPS O-acetylase OafA/YrhL n=1 Tax=Allocatelliglobosispora scoriae TaxID=643052 RepID=A0A841BVE3_9ACTN|nr:acyltransferase family protein [Allocatelliglobosispora scoriae]MBB5871436.1 peptidoglycan/LPS O-acetylase OafA/YrhL [Allocatelliglobosispora scoriae]